MSAKSLDVAKEVAVGVGTFGSYTAGKAAYKGVTDPARKAREAMENLERQRMAQLSSEASARETARKKAETTGSRFGRGRIGVLGSYGFGTGATPDGLGSGNLFGN